MKFGPKQIGKPTPASMNNLFDGISGLLGVICSFCTVATFISHSVSDVLVSVISGLLIPACPFIKRMFSATIETRQVPAEDVSVVKEHEEEE